MSEQHQGEHHHLPPTEGGFGGGQECVLCPVCVLLQAVNSARPEVMRHLLAAGRELTMALQAFLDEQAKAHGEDPGIERIDVE